VLAVGLPESTPPDAEIEELVRKREVAREAQGWSEADAIRDELAKRGVVVTDTPDGPRWHQQKPEE